MFVTFLGMVGTPGIPNLYSAAREAGLPDPTAPLRWLAWRDERVENYDPPQSALSLEHKPTSLFRACWPAPAATRASGVAGLPRVDALIVAGCAMVCIPIGAADFFVDVLYPGGCRVVVLSGGLGRGTLPLWRELTEKKLTKLFGASEPWQPGTQPESVTLPSQGTTKPVLDGFDVAHMPPEQVRSYACEADVFLELFCERCAVRGLEVVFGGNPMADGDGWSQTQQHSEAQTSAYVYLETASTNTGANVQFSRNTLAKVGVELEGATCAVVQHPQAHRRTCLTWQKQVGSPPLGWTLRPTPQDLGVSEAEMLLYALGEHRRITAYAAPEKGFVHMPEDFPHDFTPPLAQLEPKLIEIIKAGLAGGSPTAYADSLGVTTGE